MAHNGLGKAILRDIGGVENIDTFTHCTTRLRFRLKDIAKADTAHLREVRGVLGVLVSSGTYMVVIGKDVGNVYREIRELTGEREYVTQETRKKSKGMGVITFFAYMAAAAGVFYSVLELISIWSLININGDVMRTLEIIAGFGIFLLPVILLHVAEKRENETGETDKSIIYAPVKGRVIPLSEIEDSMMAEGAYGDGAAIVPESDLISSPAEGRVAEISRQRNAVTIETNDGVEILIYIGSDTGVAGSEMFKPLASVGENVSVGDPLIEIEKNALEINGIDITTAVIITNSDNYDRIKVVADVAREQKPLLEIWK